MSRARLLLLPAALCLALAASLKPQAVDAELSVEAAVGQSMGGLRVLLIDVLFLRAQSLQEKSQDDGNLEEAALLYETILELDPANDVAAAYLVDVYVGDLMPLAATPEDRFTWWRRAWDLARRAGELNPGSARVHVRTAQLLLDAFLPSDIAARVDTAIPDRRRLAVAHLARAAELRANLPRLGYIHLRILGAVAPQVAAEAAAAGDEALYREALAGARWLLDRRGAILAQMGYEVVRGEQATEVIPLDQAIRVGLEAIITIKAAMEAGDRASAREVVRRYGALCGDNLLLERLAAWVGE